MKLLNCVIMELQDSDFNSILKSVLDSYFDTKIFIAFMLVQMAQAI